MRDNQPSNAAAPRREGRRFRAMLLLSLTALAGVAFAGLALGSSSVGAADVAAFVVGNASDMANNVLANVRVPRVLGGVLAGAALAEAGALMQATLNNPLASPNVLGINSGAFVAEIIRGGIMAVDAGQMEAGRSLGFNFVQTMWYIVIPQALKSVLPALANEFIVLLKETSVACYVAVNDLTKGGEIIRSITYIQAMPLLIVAALYLAMVMFFSSLVTRLERRLRGSER